MERYNVLFKILIFYFLTPLYLPQVETFACNLNYCSIFTPLHSPPLEKLGEVGVRGGQKRK